MRGDIHRLRADRQARGHEQRGDRFAVVMLATRFKHLSTWLVVPTSTRAEPYIFRPEIEVPDHGPTRAMCDMATSVDPRKRLGELVGYLNLADMQAIEYALLGLYDLPTP